MKPFSKQNMRFQNTTKSFVLNIMLVKFIIIIYSLGAMENAGLVTFNDLYCFREQVDSSRMTRFL